MTSETRGKEQSRIFKKTKWFQINWTTGESNQSRKIEFNGWTPWVTDRDRWKSRFTIWTKRCRPHSKLIEVQWHTHCHSNNRRAFCTAWRTWCIDVWRRRRRRVSVRVRNLRWSGVRQMMTSGGHTRKKARDELRSR